LIPVFFAPEMNPSCDKTRQHKAHHITAWSDRDKRLGMDRPITRRDFLDGLALTIGGAAMASFALPGMPAQAEGHVGALPHGQIGLRGQTDDTQAVMHSIRDGKFDTAARRSPRAKPMIWSWSGPGSAALPPHSSIASSGPRRGFC